MDIDEIRRLIRQSLDQQIKREVERAKLIPESYLEFRRRLVESLIDLEAPSEVVFQIENDQTDLRDKWQEIVVEHEPGDITSWKDCAEFYLKENLVETLMDAGMPYHKSHLIISETLNNLIKS
jgi:hypothetical protein